MRTKIFLILVLFFFSGNLLAQQEGNIKELSFLIGQWNVKEENEEKDWWEESVRTGRFILDSTYIELTSHATSSNGKRRTYKWYIHYNEKKDQFEMVSMFSNWHKVQFDVLTWESRERKIIIKSTIHPDSEEYHERYGEILFGDDFESYVWTGVNKYGDPKKPGVWEYTEKGRRISDK